jgi:CubicO group peptidase (beta-lactamase class C family)
MTIEVHGFCDPRFERLKAAFVANFEADLELGASIAATWRGEPVVDLWAGWADVAKTRPWERDTLVPIFSTTKMMVTLSVLMLVDQGRIDLDAPIATYWPEFAAGGKEAVIVRDFLTHQAGVPGFTPGVPVSLFLDWEPSAARLAAEEHWFGGERRVVYHGGTYGLIGGELIRRVDGRLPAQFFREEVAGPAGLDFHYGQAEVPEPSRIAELSRPPGPPPAPEGALPLLARLMGSYIMVEGIQPTMGMNPSNNGLANARAIARGNTIFASGGVLDGKRYLSSAMVDEACREQAYGQCPYLGWMRLGLGFGLDGRGFNYPSPDGYGWGGAGGSCGWMDTRLGYSFG